MITGMGAVATPVEVSELATALATGLVVGPGEPAAQHLQPQALRGAEVRDDDRPHAVGAVGVRQREASGRRSRRPTARSWRTRWPRSGRKTLDWDRETAAKYRKDLEGQGHGLRRGEGRARRRRRSARRCWRRSNKDFPEWKRYIEQIQRGASRAASARWRCCTACARRLRWVEPRAARAADRHAAGADRDARRVQRADVGRRGAGALLPDLPGVPRRAATSRYGAGRSAMEEFQALIPPRPRWWLQLADRALRHRDVPADRWRPRRGHDPQQPDQPDRDAGDAVLAVHGAAGRGFAAAGGRDRRQVRAHLAPQAPRRQDRRIRSPDPRGAQRGTASSSSSRVPRAVHARLSGGAGDRHSVRSCTCCSTACRST